MLISSKNLTIVLLAMISKACTCGIPVPNISDGIHRAMYSINQYKGCEMGQKSNDTHVAGFLNTLISLTTSLREKLQPHIWDSMYLLLLEKVYLEVGALICYVRPWNFPNTFTDIFILQMRVNQHCVNRKKHLNFSKNVAQYIYVSI